MTPRRPDHDAPFQTIGQVADHYQTSERQVHRWITDGKLVVHRFGRMVRVHKKDRENFEKLHRCP